jgi:hypothetical protein
MNGASSEIVIEARRTEAQSSQDVRRYRELFSSLNDEDEFKVASPFLDHWLGWRLVW